MSENDERYLKSIKNPQYPTGLICPIDGSIINSTIEADFYDFNCPSCGASYGFRSSQDEINEKAKLFLIEIRKKVEVKSLELGMLEKILRTARNNKF